MPSQERPFRLPIPRVICPIAFYICNLIIFWAGWSIISNMLIALMIGYVMFIFFRRTEQGQKLNLEWDKSWWIFVYLIALGIMSYLGSFGGGKNYIPFGWDFLYLAIMSWVIYELSLYSVFRKLK